MSAAADLGWAIVRIVMGLSMAWFHGYGKVFGGGFGKNVAGFAEGVARLGFPKPLFFAWCAALAELVGALCVALGLATRVAGAAVSFTMMVALYHHRADPLAKAELAIVYLAVMLAAVLIGGGRFSLDALVFRGGASRGR